MNEKWLPIKGYEGYYEVSNHGNVRSVDRIIILKTKNGKDRPCHFKQRILKNHVEDKKKSNIMPRYYVTFSKEGKRVRFYNHRLVAEHFIPNPYNKEQVNHIDGDPFNNKVDNLEWVSRTENIRHAFENKLIKTEKPVKQIDKNTGEVINVFKSESEACRQMGVNQTKVLRAIQRNGTCKGYKWEYVSE